MPWAARQCGVAAAGGVGGYVSTEKAAENELGKAGWKLRKLNKRNE
jgi:hypothetical protein